MYEHLRNEYAAALENLFDRTELTVILAKLDKVAGNYDISEKTTALMVPEDIFPAVAKAFIASKKLEGIADTSAKNYAGILKIFFENVQKTPQDITTNDIRLFLATYKARTSVTDRTLDKYRQILNCFFTWAADEEYIPKNPCRNISAIKYEVRPRRSLTRLQLETLRRACTTKRDIALIDVLYSTGCRVTEVANMKKSDINREDKSIHIIGKGSKHNDVYLNTNAILSLEDYIKTRDDDSDYLFVEMRKPHNKVSSRTIQHVFQELSREVGFKVSPHVIRHTTATLSLQSGMPITQVQKLLGHATVSTTQIYAETLQSDVKASHQKYVI